MLVIYCNNNCSMTIYCLDTVECTSISQFDSFPAAMTICVNFLNLLTILQVFKCLTIYYKYIQYYNITYLHTYIYFLDPFYEALDDVWYLNKAKISKYKYATPD